MSSITNHLMSISRNFERNTCIIRYLYIQGVCIRYNIFITVLNPSMYIIILFKIWIWKRTLISNATITSYYISSLFTSERVNIPLLRLGSFAVEFRTKHRSKEAHISLKSMISWRFTFHISNYELMNFRKKIYCEDTMQRSLVILQTFVDYLTWIHHH